MRSATIPRQWIELCKLRGWTGKLLVDTMAEVDRRGIHHGDLAQVALVIELVEHRQALAELVEWSRRTGGWEAAVWRRAERLSAQPGPDA